MSSTGPYLYPSFEESAESAGPSLAFAVRDPGMDSIAELLLHLLPYLPADVLERLRQTWPAWVRELLQPGTYVVRRLDPWGPSAHLEGPTPPHDPAL